MGTYMTGLSNSYSGSDVLYLDSSGSVLATYGTPSVDDTLETFHTIISSFTARRLANGRLMLAGATQPQETYRSVVQLTDSTLSEVYGQFFPPHDHTIDNPAVHRCLDMNADNEIFFGQSENLGAGITSPEPGWPSAVRLYRFDGDLNVTGTYFIDGFADSSYYFLRSVRATADGGVLLTGSVADVRMNATDLRTKAWVAKVSMEDLTMPVAERSATKGWLFPNPGAEGFWLELTRPMHAGSLRITDATGRVVESRRLEGIRTHADTGSWSAGLYHVVVSDDNGLPLFSTTWIKQ